MVDNTVDPKDFRGWKPGIATFGYGYDESGNPVKQEAGAMGKGTDAKAIAGVGAVFVSAIRVTQAQYDAIAVKDPNVLYVIPEV